MYLAIFYKEWIKLRSASLVLLIISVLFIVHIWLTASYNMRINGGEIYWYYVIYRNDLFYNSLFFLPLIIGAVVVTVQFTPEMSADRLKLTLHLPASDTFILLSTVSVGTIFICILYFVILAGLFLVIMMYFPIQIFISALLTILPKLLAGLALYWAGAMIFIESNWVKRILLTVASLIFIQALYISNFIEAYTRMLPGIFVISLVFSISVLISGHRYRRGAR